MLGAFANLQKATFSFVMSVCLSCPSVRPHGTTRPLRDGFSWNLIFEHFSKHLTIKLKFRYNLTTITVTVQADLCLPLIYLADFFLELEMCQAKFVGKLQTHISYSIIFLSRAFYEIRRKNLAEADRPQMTNMAHAHCMLDTQGYKHTLRLCNTLYVLLTVHPCIILFSKEANNVHTTS